MQWDPYLPMNHIRDWNSDDYNYESSWEEKMNEPCLDKMNRSRSIGYYPDYGDMYSEPSPKEKKKSIFGELLSIRKNFIDKENELKKNVRGFAKNVYKQLKDAWPKNQ